MKNFFILLIRCFLIVQVILLTSFASDIPLPDGGKVWSIDDIKPGLFITRAYSNESELKKDLNNVFQIGINISLIKGVYTLNNISNGFANLNVYGEGKAQGYTKEQLVELLNCDIVGYRPATKLEIYEAIDHNLKLIEYDPNSYICFDNPIISIASDSNSNSKHHNRNTSCDDRMVKSYHRKIY